MTLLLVIIILALIFDYINGFHDAANSIATVVSTKVLTPFQAVVWAAFFNFVAFFIFKDHGVANTIAKTVKDDIITLPVIFSGLIAAIAWNLLTWWFGIPSSSSHTLIGGFAGAAIASAGFNSINSEPVLKTVAFILLAPLIGMIVAFVISLWFIHSFKKGWQPRIISLIILIGIGLFLSNALKTAPSELSGLTFEHQKEKVQVANVPNKSMAQQMGFKKNDVLISINGLAVTATEQLDRAWKDLKTGDAFSYAVERTNKAGVVESKTIETTFQSKFDSKTVSIILFGENFKWILLALILSTLAIFSIFLNTLNAHKANAWFKKLQLVSSAAFSIGHGGNDAQKVMGIITAALIANGDVQSFEQMPVWVPLACYSAISLGTMSGGWKIIKTMGTRITKVTPFEGVAAETAGALTLFVTEALKIPVSTTHTITGSIIGVGATKRLSAVRWGVTVNLIWAWVLTIPVSAVLAALVYKIFHLFA